MLCPLCLLGTLLGHAKRKKLRSDKRIEVIYETKTILHRIQLN